MSIKQKKKSSRLQHINKAQIFVVFTIGTIIPVYLMVIFLQGPLSYCQNRSLHLPLADNWSSNAQIRAAASVQTTQTKKTENQTQAERCDRADEKRIPRTKLNGNETIYQMGVFFSRNYGNVLSPYWAARVLAELGGYKFEGKKFGKGTFMEFLPTKVPAKPSRKHELERFLCNCPQRLGYYHECPYGHGNIAETIRHDTRMALRQFAAGRSEEEQRKALGSMFKKDDWLIYDRCCLLGHSLHGFATLSVYDVLPTEGAYTVYSLSGREEGEQSCEELHRIRDEYIKSRNPNITIKSFEQSSEIWIDFARLVFSPNLLIPSAGSSWALWAKLANSGRVVTVKNKPDDDPSTSPSNFEVLRNATVLYNPEVHAPSAKLLGFDKASDANTWWGKRLLLECYKNC